MKKLLVLLVSVALVLSLAAVSMAAASVSGELKAKYEFTDSEDDQDPFDKLETAVTVSGVSGNIAGSVTFKADSEDETDDFNIDAYTIKYTAGWGTWTIGKWGYAAKGLVDVIDPIYGDFKAAAAMAFEGKFGDGFNAGLWYAFDKCTDGEGIGDGAYVGTLGYTNDAFAVSAFLVDCGEDNSDKDGFALNFTLTMVDNLALYVNYEDDDDDETSLILGGKYSTDAFFVQAEINLEDDDWYEDYYGIKFHYNFTDAFYGEAKWVNTGDDATCEELLVGFKF